MSQFPALTGEVVTERHARICRERGHATHTVDGVDTGSCPRCGDVTETPVPVDARFPQMAKLEQSAKLARLTAGMGRYFWDRQRGEDTLQSAKSELFALMDSLSPDDLAAYGEYRKSL